MWLAAATEAIMLVGSYVAYKTMGRGTDQDFGAGLLENAQSTEAVLPVLYGRML